MPYIHFIAHDGTTQRATAEVGQSLMQVVVSQGVPGIIADCGGNGSCATCHVYVEAPWSEQIPPAGPDEAAMLEFTLHTRSNSRLACQVVVTPEMDEATVRTPISQT